MPSSNNLLASLIDLALAYAYPSLWDAVGTDGMSQEWQVKEILGCQMQCRALPPTSGSMNP